MKLLFIDVRKARLNAICNVVNLLSISNRTTTVFLYDNRPGTGIGSHELDNTDAPP